MQSLKEGRVGRNREEEGLQQWVKASLFRLHLEMCARALLEDLVAGLWNQYGRAFEKSREDQLRHSRQETRPTHLPIPTGVPLELALTENAGSAHDGVVFTLWSCSG